MRIRPLLPLAGCLLILGCGHQADRGDETPSMALGSLPPPQSNGVLEATLESTHRSATTLWVRLRLENLTTKPVELRNLGDTLTGFCCIIDGQRFNAPVQRGVAATAASSLSQLPPETPVELDLSWHIPAGPAHGDYPFTVVIGNLFQDGTKLKDVYLATGMTSGDVLPHETSSTTDAAATPGSPAASPAPTAPSATAAAVSM